MKNALVVKLVDTPVLGTGASRLVGSSPTEGKSRFEIQMLYHSRRILQISMKSLISTTESRCQKGIDKKKICRKQEHRR